MSTQSARGSKDAAIGRLADAQYGLITRGQLIERGVGRRGIAERLRTGRLRRLHRGVYAVGHQVLRAEAYWLAGVLACGPGAALSHRSAAALWELRGDASTFVEVTVSGRNGRQSRPGIRVHRPVRLGPADVTRREGIPVTTVARTLLDLADVLPEQALKRAIDQAEYRGLFDMASLEAAVRSSQARRGRKVLMLAGGPAELTRSELERRFLAFVDRHRLPRPAVGLPLEGYELDFFWPEAKLIAELDGREAHLTREAFESDRARDRRLLTAGVRTVRITDRALREDDGELATQLAALVGARKGSR